MNHYGLIMAGGSGTRFWPMSRQKLPKQLLNLSGKDLMVNEAVDRIATVIGKKNIFIVTTDVQTPAVVAATQGRVYPQNILAEPSERNTAACIGYSAMVILRKHGDGVMVVTPADHYIKDVSALTEIFQAAILDAETQDRLITIGVKPTFPSTGFGYIKYDPETEKLAEPVIEFHEKPNEKAARQYVESGYYVWNSGMFIWKASLILEKLKKYAPDIYEDLKIIGDAVNTPQEQAVLHAVYPGIRKVSIDYAVLEPSAANGEVLVIPGEFGWNDIGNWEGLGCLHDPDENGNILLGDSLVFDVKDSVLYSSGRLIAAVQVDNLVIAETPDAVMVCRKDKAQEVRRIIDALSDMGRGELL